MALWQLHTISLCDTKSSWNYFLNGVNLFSCSKWSNYDIANDHRRKRPNARAISRISMSEWVCAAAACTQSSFFFSQKNPIWVNFFRFGVILTQNHLNDCRATPNSTIHRFIRTHKTNLNSAVRLQFSNAHSLRKWNEEKLMCVYRVIFIISLQACYVRCWHDFCTIYLIRWAMHVRECN